jgi:hypothetical protein
MVTALRSAVSAARRFLDAPPSATQPCPLEAPAPAIDAIVAALARAGAPKPVLHQMSTLLRQAAGQPVTLSLGAQGALLLVGSWEVDVVVRGDSITIYRTTTAGVGLYAAAQVSATAKIGDPPTVGTRLKATLKVDVPLDGAEIEATTDGDAKASGEIAGARLGVTGATAQPGPGGFAEVSGDLGVDAGGAIVRETTVQFAELSVDDIVAHPSALTAAVRDALSNRPATHGGGW